MLTMPSSLTLSRCGNQKSCSANERSRGAMSEFVPAVECQGAGLQALGAAEAVGQVVEGLESFLIIGQCR